jgi:DNA polymerase-1
MSVSSVTKQGNSGEEKDAERGEKFKRYGWMCNELNLSTLPEDAPDGARNIAEWLTLEGRRSSLVEWLGHVKDDGRIHGRFTHIGAWTGRMAHSAPNQANIPAAFHGKVKSAVDAVKEKYDGKMRALWKVEDGNWLVGTDAEGIQLRILAHLMKSEEYIHAIVSGKKEDETDIHNVNKRALGMSHVTRDMAKTFIYAFLLGAGNDKVAEILKVSSKEAGQAVENFMESIQGLSRLKKQVIPHIAEMGWFKGLDGRRVSVPSEHKTLAGLLQNGEAVVMKHAAISWTNSARAAGIKFKLVTWPHDEWQTEVEGTKEEAEHLGSIQRQSIVDTGKKLSILCPLAGSTDIGRDWFQTH